MSIQSKDKKIVIQSVKESDNLIICSLDLNLIHLPMIQIMWVLNNLRLSFVGHHESFFKFDDETQAYWDANEEAFLAEVAKEGVNFAQFREMVLGEAVGSLYNSVHVLMNLVSSVYALKPLFDELKPVRIPSVMYRVFKPQGQDDLILDIANLQDYEGFNNNVLLSWVNHFLNFLDYNHALTLNKPTKSIHSVSEKIRKNVYPDFSVDGAAKGVLSFNGVEAALISPIILGLSKLKNPERILKMLNNIDLVLKKKSTKPVVTELN